MKWTVSVYSLDGRLVFSGRCPRDEAIALAREARSTDAYVRIYLRSPTGEVTLWEAA